MILRRDAPRGRQAPSVRGVYPRAGLRPDPDASPIHAGSGAKGRRRFCAKLDNGPDRVLIKNARNPARNKEEEFFGFLSFDQNGEGGRLWRRRHDDCFAGARVGRGFDEEPAAAGDEDEEGAAERVGEDAGLLFRPPARFRQGKTQRMRHLEGRSGRRRQPRSVSPVRPSAHGARMARHLLIGAFKGPWHLNEVAMSGAPSDVYGAVPPSRRAGAPAHAAAGVIALREILVFIRRPAFDHQGGNVVAGGEITARDDAAIAVAVDGLAADEAAGEMRRSAAVASS